MSTGTPNWYTEDMKDMAKTPYLHRPKGSNNFHFRRKIPLDLTDHYGKKLLKFSLGTSDRQKAEELARLKAVEYDQEFAEIRRQQAAEEIEELSVVEINRIKAMWLHQLLEEDQESRIGGYLDVDGDFNDMEFEEDADTIDALGSLAKHDLARGISSHIQFEIDDFLESHGVKLDKEEGGYQRVCYALQETWTEALRIMKERHAGEVRPTPLAPTEKVLSTKPERKKAELMTIEEAVEKYVDFKINGPKKWAASSQKDIPPQVRQFPQIIGKDKLIGDLCRDDMRLYWESMMKLPSRRMSKPYKDKSLKQLLRMNIPEGERLSPKTLDTRFTNIKTFLNWCEDEGCVDRARPLNKVLIAPEPEPTAAKRTTFDQSDLKNLFHPGRYGQGKLFTKPWHYWLPLLALFTGARVEELSQLHTDDIKQIGAVWVLDINEVGDKRVKTKAGKRRVPIHSFLINDLKFLDFVDMMRRQTGDQVFKDLPFNERTGKRSDKVSKWFTRYRRTCGVGAMEGVSSLTFHSFRHTMITWCKHHDINRDKYKEVVGHERGEVRDVTSGYEGSQLVEKLLHEVIEPIDFHTTIPLNYLKRT